MITKNELIRKIEFAFSEEKYPGDDNLVILSYGEEPELVKNHFRGHNNWKILPDAFIDFDGALSYLSDNAFRFYIAAFLIADLNGKLDYNDPVVRLCWPLTPQTELMKVAKIYGGETIAERAKKNFDAFSSEQTSAIVSYLNWRRVQDENNYIIEQAIKNYWLPREKSFK